MSSKQDDSGESAKKPSNALQGKRLSDEAVEHARGVMFDGVGYGQPPKHTQFKKGQSGNPKGRPRGIAADLSMAEQPTLKAVLNASRSKVKIREGDKVTEVPSIEAVIKSVIATALKGNARSQGLAIDLARTAEQAHAREIERENELWSLVKATRQRQLDEAIELGRPTRDILPHPDDIIIDHVNGPKIVGPVHLDELTRCEETIAFCEVLLMQNELDERSTNRLNGEPLEDPGAALLEFHLLQRSLPPRLQMPTAVAVVRMGRYQAWPKRKLLRELFQAWRKLGKLRPRGYVSPNLTDKRKQIELICELASESFAGRIDADAMARGEYNDRAREVFERYGIWVSGQAA